MRPTFKLLQTPLDNWEPAAWTEVVAETDDTLQSILPFKSFFALYRRHDGLPEIVLYEPSDAELQTHVIAVDDATWDIWPSSNAMYDTDVFRYGLYVAHHPEQYPRNLTCDKRFNTRDDLRLATMPRSTRLRAFGPPQLTAPRSPSLSFTRKTEKTSQHLFFSTVTARTGPRMTSTTTVAG